MSAFLVERRAELLGLVAQHLVLVLLSTAIAVLVGGPLGILMTRRRGLARPMLAAAGLLQTIPSLALFGFLIPLPLVGGIGARVAVVALVLYALLPILRNTYTAVLQVDPAVVEAATGLGMTDGQRLRLVELPLALPVILAGVRIAAVVSVGTATIAAAVGAGGLGTYVFRGLATLDTRLILAGAIPAAILALTVDGLLALVERSSRPLRAASVLAGTVVAGLLVLALAGRGGAGETRIVVGSKNFTEQVVLGEILAGALEHRGVAVDRRLNLGGTALCHDAVRTGDLDLYVEYTGTALKEILRRPASGDRAAVLREVREAYLPLGLTVAAPLGFNNTYALVTRRDTSQRLRMTRLSDLAREARTMRMGMFGEFIERADGLSGLMAAYGFRLAVPPTEMDMGLLYSALLAGRVDVVVGNATDGLIAAHDLVVLEDDRHYFPPYDAVPIVHTASLAAHPAIRSVLDALAGRLDETTMRRLNLAVDGEHQSPAVVAATFLRGAGL
jgi:osmoprotectant transport system permease protein